MISYHFGVKVLHMSQKKKYCVNCFIILPGETELCTGCDYEQPEEDSPLYLKPPFRLNNQYFIGRVLGHGGFAITYLAYDRNLSIRVAIKEYFPIEFANRNQDGSSVAPYTGQATELFNLGKEKFINEARLLTSFRSPNIIKIRQFFKAWNTGYFVMEYLEGDTLTQYVMNNGGKLSYAEVRKLLLPLLSALEEVHQKGTFHRDIKPDNIYITQKREPILLDFGAARQTVSGRTTNLLAFLTPGFAPMEQYSINGIQGPWTDIYALAATIYYALTGELPPTPTDRITGDAELIPPSQLGSDIPKEEEVWLLKALEVRWSARPDSIQSWRAMIDPKIHVFKPTPETQVKAAEENFTKIAILPKLTKQILTRREEEEIYASAAYMEIPLDKVRDLIKAALEKTGAVRRDMTKAEEEEIRLAKELKQREEELQRKEEEFLHYEELRNKEEELWWDAELAQQANIQREHKEKEEQRKKENELHELEQQRITEELKRREEELKRKEDEFQHYEKLRHKEEELRRDAEQRKLKEDELKRKEEELQRESEQRKLKEDELKRKEEELQRKESELQHSEKLSATKIPKAEQDASTPVEEENEELAEDELNELLELLSDKAPNKQAKKQQIPNSEVLNNHYAKIAADFSNIQPTAKKLLAPNLLSLPQRLTNALGMDFVLIYPSLEGTGFMLYQAFSVGPKEHKFQAVLTKPFYLQTTPVTQQQWQNVMKNNPSHFHQEPKAPVERVSWDDCQLLIHCLNLSQEARYRLPTEVEWEFACRASCATNNLKDASETLPEYAWYADNAEQKTQPVGQKKANELGLFDIQGNVREWVQDWYDTLPEGEFINPHGGGNKSQRVVRGGGWNAPSTECHSSYRAGENSGQRINNLGFRLAIEIL